MTAEQRAARTRTADALCVEAFAKAECPESGVALLAVGGYGRGELAPYSDLDVVLVHDGEAGPWAGDMWYPLWDSGASIDHAVRRTDDMLAQSTSDLRVALGLLDLRHLAGDPNLTLRLRSAVLTRWRQDARDRLADLHALVRERGRRAGELAHVSVPDLKECVGGLRDATVLKALVATWLVDVPNADLERCRLRLLDVRDVVHELAGRASDRVAPELWPELAARLDLPDDLAAQRHVRGLGRRITHLSRLTWRRAEAVLERPAHVRVRRPQLEPLALGVARSGPEVVLDAGTRPDRDPLLLLRAAAEAATRGLALSPATAARLVRECPPLPDPWPAEARDLFVRLIASGEGLREVWETLEETDATRTFLPEWERVRLLPHASPIHRFTVDRHLVETAVNASALIRRVARPDVLAVAAILHDIGKGGLTEHCVAGEPIAREIARRVGFDARQVDLVAGLVRRHLLLADTATTRDPDDPATVEVVTAHVRDREELALLAALTEADARATAEKAWTPWRAGLVAALVRRVDARLADEPAPADPEPTIAVPPQVRADPRRAVVEVREDEHGTRVSVISGDRVGLLADVAATLAWQRASVRAARAWSEGDLACSEWDVDGHGLDAAVLRQRLEAIAAGTVDVGRRLGRPVAARLEPSVAVRPEASRSATVIEVRAEDRPGTLYTVCAALAAVNVTVRSAHVDTLGPQAVDVFYVQEEAAGALSEPRAAAAAHAVREALSRLHRVE